MGKKKRGHPDVEEILARPWCYYCERDFDDLKILISHQKAKHFKCDRCGRRLNTAGGLSVHMSQVHKETLTQVDNALPNRIGLDIEIFGMEGIPEEIVQAHRQRVLTQFHQAETDRRAATGNPAPGGAGQPGQAKKPKIESISEMKKRLAEHKAAKLAAEQGGSAVGSGSATPNDSSHGAIQPNSPMANSPMSYTATPSYSAHPQSFNGSQAPPSVAAPPSFAPPYANSPNPYQQPAAPPFQPYQNTPQYANSPTGFVPPPFPGAPPMAPYPMSHSPSTFQPQFAPPSNTPPPAVGGLPPRPGSLPNAPGLPQRPAFGAPQVNTQMMQQMHHGSAAPEKVNPYRPQDLNSLGASSRQDETQNSLDNMISEAAKQADTPRTEPEDKEAPKAPAKKEKEKKQANTKLVFSDNEVSPEEKLACLDRYAFDPLRNEETILVDATASSAVTGVVAGSDDVLDRAAQD